MNKIQKQVFTTDNSLTATHLPNRSNEACVTKLLRANHNKLKESLDTAAIISFLAVTPVRRGESR